MIVFLILLNAMLVVWFIIVAFKIHELEVDLEKRYLYLCRRLDEQESDNRDKFYKVYEAMDSKKQSISKEIDRESDKMWALLGYLGLTMSINNSYIITSLTKEKKK